MLTLKLSGKHGITHSLIIKYFKTIPEICSNFLSLSLSLTIDGYVVGPTFKKKKSLSCVIWFAQKFYDHLVMDYKNPC